MYVSWNVWVSLMRLLLGLYLVVQRISGFPFSCLEMFSLSLSLSLSVCRSVCPSLAFFTLNSGIFLLVITQVCVRACVRVWEHLKCMLWYDAFHTPQSSGHVTETHQYSVAEYLTRLNTTYPPTPPSLDFIYEISPIVMNINDQPPSILHLVVRVCAVLSGVFALTSKFLLMGRFSLWIVDSGRMEN